jgi:hypothetical protein
VTNEPDFRDLIGEEGDPEELERLRRIHDLLVAAGPPPELPPQLEQPPSVAEAKAKIVPFPRRRKALVVWVAAAAVAASFLVGYLVAYHRTGFSAKATIAMHGVGALSSAEADLKVASHDTGGNYPLEMTVSGLHPLPKGGWYELLLSKHGRPTLPCGAFIVDGGKQLTVRLSVPYDLSARGKLFDGWVVIRHVPGQHGTAPVVMTT